LVEAWKAADARLSARGVMAELVVAGDGPYRAEMERALRGTRARFLGFRHGEELSRVYASCDVFAFPSLTDTLGQVVMESQSSGLAVLVTDQGGPKEMVRDGETGFVIPTAMEADDPASIRAWAERIEALVVDGAMRERMGKAAHEAMQPYSMEHSFEHYWRVHEAVRHDHLWRRGVQPRADGGQVQERSELAEYLEEMARR
jgi:glycosyltransferase involved in cell wall biosynthesis